MAEWIHFTLSGITLPTIKLKVYTFGGPMNSATKNYKLHHHLIPSPEPEEKHPAGDAGIFLEDLAKEKYLT